MINVYKFLSFKFQKRFLGKFKKYVNYERQTI